jgi:hypothetical protein
MPRSSILGVVVLGAVALAPVGSWAGAPAVVTILEGNATLFRGTSKLAASECVQVQPADLIETGKQTFVRLEFEDGTRLDLGPRTQLQVDHPTELRADRPALYTLTGWIKLTLNGAQHAAAPAFATPLFDGTDLGGVVLARVDAGGGAMFVEQGRARFADRRARGSSPVLKAGDFVSFAGSGRAVVEPRPASEFVDRMPSEFRDSIPSRLAHCRDHAVAARTVGEFSYGEVEAWINAEPAVRRQFVHAWRAKAEDTEFRFELTSKLSRHPEWGPVLFPELYAPKPPPDSQMVGPPWPPPQPDAAPH